MCPHYGRANWASELLRIQGLPPEPREIPDLREWLIQRSCQFYDHGFEAPHAMITNKQFARLSELPEEFGKLCDTEEHGVGVRLYLAWGHTTFMRTHEIRDGYVIWIFGDSPRLARVDYLWAAA
jgi:hypothetical protein